MKKQLLSFVAISTITITAMAQPAIQWIKDFGGTNIDRGYFVIPGTNGSYIMAGLSISTDGNSVSNHGSYDALVVNVDASGNVIWDECYGSTLGEGANYIAKAAGGGYFVMANTLSTDSTGTQQVTGGHGNYDWWIFKINSNGVFQWGKCVGSTGSDGIHGVTGTADGGCVATGSAGAKDGDFATGGDGWAVKLNSSGNISWKSTYGQPNSPDILRGIIETKDGNIMISGGTNSPIGGNHGGADLWALKVSSANGSVIWQKCFGGTGNEQGVGVTQLADESYVFAGIATSNDGDLSGLHIGGTYDGFAVRCDKDGNLIWAKCYGGTGDEELLGVTATTDGGLLFGGDSQSTDLPNVTGTWHGSDDMWIVKTDGNGTSKWQKQIGGGSYDYAWSVAQGTDGSYAAVGYTKSSDGDLSTAALGNMDYIMVRIAPEPLGVDYNNVVEKVTVYPNPFTNSAMLYISNASGKCTYQMDVYDVTGNLVKSANISQCNTSIEREQLTAGSYFYKIIEATSQEVVSTSRFVVY